MTQPINIAVLGATGAVGEAIFKILQERQFPVGEIYALASAESAGERIDFNKKSIIVQDAENFDFRQAQVALFSAGGSVSEKFAPRATSLGCVVIDNTSQFRYDPDIPLVVPEVNAESIAQYKNKNIIANPNCSTIQMVVALKPIYDQVGIKRINVATYQAVSGSGRSGLKELAGQTAKLLNGVPVEPEFYPKQIAFNVVPQIDVFLDNGYTREEMKMVWETQKIMNDESIMVNPTAVRVPVFYGHSEAIHVETRDKITAEAARVLLENAPGVTVVDDLETSGYPTPVAAVSDWDANQVFVGRIREDISCDKGLNLWVVSDNIRKGAALNAVQIAEILVAEYL